MSDKKIRVGVSIGDPNGVGMEVVIKTFQDLRLAEMCIPIVYGSKHIASFHRKQLGIEDFSFNGVAESSKANAKKPNMVNVIGEDFKVQLGKATASGGAAALASLEAAVGDLKEGQIDVLVTAPINKQNMPQEEFPHNGHTGYFGEHFEGDPIMIMATDRVRVAVLTGHIPVKEVAKQVKYDNIYKHLVNLNKTLQRDFNIVKPKIAVLGLNPHAGDNGLIGSEEQEEIIPAIREAKNAGLVVFGPYGADGFFGSGAYKDFDLTLAMYHDQGLIPFKSLEFSSGVNFTSGLNIVRTSPGHGTAYDLAGKGEASEASFREALYMALDVHRNRQLYDEATADPLKIKPKQD